MNSQEPLAHLSAEKKRAILARVLQDRARETRRGRAPLSFAQERMWFLHELNPASAAFNLHYALMLRGELDVVALEQALNNLFTRHDVLRTTFPMDGDRPLQVVTPAYQLTLSVSDVGVGVGHAAFSLMREAAIQERRRPFRLTEGPLIRARLYRLAEKEHVLFLVVHHIVADGWSIGLLIQEVASHYSNRVRTGRAAPLEELPIQYGDFARWQRGWLKGEALDAQLRYWTARLAGALPYLQLPCDGERVAEPGGATQSTMLARPFTDELKKLARTENTTLFMVLLAGLQVFLRRLSGEEGFTVGTPIAGRTRRETEDLIGFFVNMLVLRADVGGDPTFRELLGRVRGTVLEAFANQDLPFERLLEELRPDRDPMRTPLFQVYFNMLNFQERPIEFVGLVAEILPPFEVNSNFDLTLYVREEHGALDLSFLYRTELFSRERIAHMLQQFAQILELAAEDPSRKIGGVSLVTPAGRNVLPDPRQPLDSCNGETLLGRFTHYLQRSSERPAVVEAGVNWTYQDVECRANGLAASIAEVGVSGADVVGILAQRTAAVVPALLSVVKVGASFALLDSALPVGRLLQCLEAVDLSAWIELDGVKKTDPRIEAFFAEGLLKYRTRFPSGTAAPQNGGGRSPSIRSFEGLGGYVAFTSGTTGGVKGIQGTQGPIAHFLSWYERTFDLGPNDRFSMLSGLSHDPLLRDVFAPLWVGGTLCVPNSEDLLNPARLRRWMAGDGVTVSHLTPQLARVLTEDANGGELPSLRLICLGGDVLTSEVVRSLRRVAPRARIVNFYGATETPQAMGWYDVPPDFDDRPGRTVPLGRGIDGVQLLVLAENGQLAGVGELGEIVIRTPHLVRGYLGDEALTRARFITNPFTEDPDDRMYRTGDLGRFSPDGFVEFCGRRDGQVKIRGYRIETREIEAVIEELPGVKQAVVLTREDPRGDTQLIGYVVGEGGLTAAALRNGLAARLPDYMVPSAWVFLDRLPLTPNGKVDRRNLPDPEAQPAGTEHHVAPRTPTEESLVTIWKEVLKIERVGVEDNFFDLGGHSLLVMQVVSRVERVLGIALPVRTFFDLPTIAALAAEIERRRSQARAILPDNEIKVTARGAHRVRVTALDPLAGEERTR